MQSNKILKKVLIGSSLLFLLCSQGARADWGADVDWIDSNRPVHTNGFSNPDKVVWTDDYGNNISAAIDACDPDIYCVVKVNNPGGGFVFDGFTLTRSKIKIEGVDNPIIKPNANSNYITIWNDDDNPPYMEEIVIQGLTFESHDFGDGSYKGIIIQGGNINDIQISDNKAEWLSTTVTENNVPSGCVICVIGTCDTENIAIRNVTISGNYLNHISTGNGEAISVSGNMKNWEIKNNEINNIDFIAIATGGGFQNTPNYSVDKVRFGYIENNIVNSISGAGGFGGSNDEDQGIGIYIDGGQNILVQDNEVISSAGAYNIGAEECTITKNIILKNNTATNSYTNPGLPQFGSLYAGAFYEEGFDRNSSNPYATQTELCQQDTTSDQTTTGKGYVEYITVTDNNFDQVGSVGMRLTHAVIQEGIGFTTINTDNNGYPPQGDDNANAIIYPQQGGGVSANNDSATVAQGDSVTIDVLANDSGSGLTVYAVDDTWTGSISIVNNKLVYNASGSYTGNIEVWYGAQNSNGDEDWAMVTITINPQQAGLNTNDDWATVVKGNSVTIDVLANDFGSGLTISDVDDTWTGSISIVNNKLVYNASGSYTGNIEVWYGAQDSNGDEDWAMVTIHITN